MFAIGMQGEGTGAALCRERFDRGKAAVRLVQVIEQNLIAPPGRDINQCFRRSVAYRSGQKAGHEADDDSGNA
jgi:hypothetical protein